MEGAILAILKHEVLLFQVIERIEDLLNPVGLHHSPGFVELFYYLALSQQITKESWILVSLRCLQDDIHSLFFTINLVDVGSLAPVDLVLAALIIEGIYCNFIIFHCDFRQRHCALLFRELFN